jgi:fatty-acid desaturase
MTKTNIIPLVIRLRLIVFTILSMIGLYFLWEPTYLIYSVVALFLFSNIGHEIGLHRYYSHQSFTCNKPVEVFLWTCGFLSGISDAYSYTQRHLRHHRYSDTEFDTQQPDKHPFLTWIGLSAFKSKPVDMTKIPVPSKIANSKFHLFVNKYYFILYYTMLFVCLAINFKLAFYILVIPTALAQHITQGASVVTHRFGYRNFETNDNSTNPKFFNYIFGIGGLHNNHHKFPYSYTSKILPHESDPSGWLIKNIFASSVMPPPKV